MLRNLWSRWQRFLVRLSGADVKINNFETVWVTLVLLMFLLVLSRVVFNIPDNFFLFALFTVWALLTVTFIISGSVSLVQYILRIIKGER